MSKKLLTQLDFEKAAKRLRCDVAAIKTVSHVEARGNGFYEDGFPVILFERHKFYKYCDPAHRAEWRKKYPAICNPSAGGYGPAGQNQKNKFQLAFSLDPIAAMKACSWGRFQIMGFNYEVCGFKSVGEFVDAIKESEGTQLLAFVEFIINNGLADELRNHKWEDLARAYNGEDYKKNNYHIKLPEAYKKFKNEKPTKEVASQKVSTLSKPEVETTGNVGVQVNAPELPSQPGTDGVQTTIKTDNVEMTSTTQTPSSQAPENNFQAMIPQIDTARTYLKTLFGGGIIAGIGAFWMGLPMWIQISLVAFIAIVVISGTILFVRYYKDIFSFVTAMNTLRATQGVGNPVLVKKENI